MDCIFCRIAAHEVPAVMVSDEPTLVVFEDAHPKAPVHLLVIPKRHIESLLHLDAAERGLAAEMIFAAKRAAAERGLLGYKLAVNVGRAGGQVVDHLHMHLLGGWEKPEDWKKGFLGDL